MPKLKPVIPDNLKRLWRGDDPVQEWAEEVISRPEYAYLQDHLELVEAYMDCVEMVRRNAPEGERHHALCGLFLRSFDGLSQCVRSAMSGIFTGSVMFARDLLETSFLISFLMSEPGRPEAWLKADARTVKRTYAPLSIRKALDDRDGFFEMKRKAHYDRLSQLTHPTPFALDLKRDGQGLIHSGPIKQIELLKACLEEAAIASILLGECLLRYCRDEVANGRSLSSRLSIALQRTREVYLKR